MPTQKKSRRKAARRGRPELSGPDRDEQRQRRIADGKRVAQALESRGLTQAEAARRSGIQQGALNAIINGNRDLNREDLRRLGRIGISADYLLGLTRRLFRPGGTRSPLKLTDELADAVWSQVSAEPITLGERTLQLNGVEAPAFLKKKTLIPFLVERVRAETIAELDWLYRWNSFMDSYNTEPALEGMHIHYDKDTEYWLPVLREKIEELARMAEPSQPSSDLVDGISWTDFKEINRH